MAADGQADAAVLRDPLLGDVEVPHDLEARDHSGDHAPRNGRGVVQDAVDAVADPHLLAVGLEVNVRGAFLDALGDHAVDELDDRCLAGRLADLGDRAASPSAPLLVLFDRLGDRGVELARIGDRRDDVLGGGDHRAHVEPGHDRDVVDGPHVGRVRHRDHQRVVLDEGDRDRAVALRSLVRDQVDGTEVELEDAQVDVVEAEALGRRTRQLVGVDRAVGEQHRAPAYGRSCAPRRSHARPPGAARSQASTMCSVTKPPEPPRRLGGVRPVLAAGRWPGGCAAPAWPLRRARCRSTVALLWALWVSCGTTHHL